MRRHQTWRVRFVNDGARRHRYAASRCAIAILLSVLTAVAHAQTAPSPASAALPPTTLSPQAALGRELFFDTRLSQPPGTACASCHDPKQGWGGNNGAKTGTATGSTPGTLGRRNSPTLAYVGYVPGFHLKRDDGRLIAVGGLFWDGRANSLEEQARGPLFAKDEMNLAGEADLAERLGSAPYAARLRDVFGLATNATPAQWAQAALSAIAMFQRSGELAPFSSKYDAVLKGEARFSAQEARGQRWFNDPHTGNCIACHAVKKSSRHPPDHLFTDFTYDTLGLPRNNKIEANRDPAFFDLGLCGPSRERPKALGPDVCGAFKVPTLRNVALRPFYFHNGSFTDLTEAVRFYVERDTHPEKWYGPQAKGRRQPYDDLPRRLLRNVNRDEVPYDRPLGQRPRLTDAQIKDVVVFLNTLTDGFKP